MRIPACETLGCGLTRGHALSKPGRPCMAPLPPVTHRRIAYPASDPRHVPLERSER